MSKFSEICEEWVGQLVGMLLVFALIYYVASFFFGGEYTNKKIACVKNHEPVEARYYILSGCWYWDENLHKMVKDSNSQEKNSQRKKTVKIGEIVNGYRFKGGNPRQKENWEKIDIQRNDEETIYAPEQKPKMSQEPVGSMIQIINPSRANKKTPVVGEVRNGISFLGFNEDGSMKFERVK